MLCWLALLLASPKHRRQRGPRSPYRPKLAARRPRCIPDDKFNELFAGLSSHRDRALVAFWVSTRARASELLGARGGDVDAGQQLITVIRKGTRAMQQLPASPDAFVWLRLYQAQMHGLVPAGRDDPLWWTLRKPFRQLTYHAARRMFTRANDSLGTNWSLHDLRHSAAYQVARRGRHHRHRAVARTLFRSPRPVRECAPEPVIGLRQSLSAYRAQRANCEQAWSASFLRCRFFCCTAVRDLLAQLSARNAQF